MVNQKVDTPLGQGIEQGRYAVTDGNGTVIGARRLVRLAINDETAKHLQDENCITPRASHSGLWTFPIGEQGG